MIRGIDAWPGNGPVTVGRHLVPFLEGSQDEKRKAEELMNMFCSNWSGNDNIVQLDKWMDGYVQRSRE